jgi:hypothetical protein
VPSGASVRSDGPSRPATGAASRVTVFHGVAAAIDRIGP